MLCTFSKDLSVACVPSDDWRITTVESVARLAKTRAAIKWAKNLDVRFTLPNADFAQHDLVIESLLKFDPAAKIATAKAIYYGLDDFLAQKSTRVD